MKCGIFSMVYRALAAIKFITTSADYFTLQLLVAVFYLYSAHFTGVQAYTQSIQHLSKSVLCGDNRHKI